MRFGASESGDHDFRLRLIDTEGKEIIQAIEGRMHIGDPPNGQFSSINVVINFNQLKLDKPGRYSFELFVDGEWKSGLPLFLHKIN